MADVVKPCRTGHQILNGGFVTGVDKLGNHQYVGPTGIGIVDSGVSYAHLEMLYSGRFDDPRYYTGDTSA